MKLHRILLRSLRIQPKEINVLGKSGDLSVLDSEVHAGTGEEDEGTPEIILLAAWMHVTLKRRHGLPLI